MPLDDHLLHGLVCSLCNKTNPSGAWYQVQLVVPEDVLMKIACILPPYDNFGPDVRSYSVEAQGSFSVAKMYQRLFNFHPSDDSAH